MDDARRIGCVSRSRGGASVFGFSLLGCRGGRPVTDGPRVPAPVHARGGAHRCRSCALVGIRQQRLPGWSGAWQSCGGPTVAFGMGVAGVSRISRARDAGGPSARSTPSSEHRGGEDRWPGPASGRQGFRAAPPCLPAQARALTNLSYLPTGFTVVALRPLAVGERLAAAQAFGWRVARPSSGIRCFALALFVGLTLRRPASRARLPVLVAGAATSALRACEGNLGTAYRHRAEVVWVVAISRRWG